MFGRLLAVGAAELRLRVPAEERDGHDADDGDEGHEEGVLHQGGATLVVAELGTQVGREERVAGEQGVLSFSSSNQTVVRLNNIMTG